MNVTQTSVLLIEDNDHDAAQIQTALASSPGQPFKLEWVTRLEDALLRLYNTSTKSHAVIDVILLDLTLPDGQGLDVFDQVSAAAPNTLILILHAANDEELAQQARLRGAHDVLYKGNVDAYWLPRALRYVNERKISELKLTIAKNELAEEKDRAHVTLNVIHDAVLTTDVACKLTFLNQSAEILTGWSLKEALGRPITDVFNIINGATRETVMNPAQRAIDLNADVELDANSLLLRRDGSEVAIEDSASPLHSSDGNIMGAVIVFHDVSESRAMVQKMAHLAQHDFLTGLPNRLLLVERLCRAMGLAHRINKKVALLFIDLDYFKHVNDSLGHAIGDQLLMSVAQRLVKCVRATDSVCRQGGDEFVILLTEIEQPQDAAFMAEKILAAFATPHPIGIHELHVSLSIGISIYPHDGDEVEMLLQCADSAMYHAKASGRNNFQFFKKEMNRRAIHRSVIETSLRRALKNNEFMLHYQPKIDLNSGRIMGAEALIRWQDPVHGLVLPKQFITIAEECGLIVPIGRWVLSEACRQLKLWLDTGLKVVPVAINVSAIELKHSHFLQGISDILAATRVPPKYLEIELTESVLMKDAEFSIKTLKALKKKGIKLAIDDFGTSFSSLSYLHRLPIDTLKIDQSFVHNMDKQTENVAIINAVIGLGRNLSQKVIAEGVETPEQLAMLREQNCVEGQGFHFSRPLAANDFARLLEENQLSAHASQSAAKA